jgi:hypothetical protein
MLRAALQTLSSIRLAANTAVMKNGRLSRLAASHLNPYYPETAAKNAVAALSRFFFCKKMNISLRKGNADSLGIKAFFHLFIGVEEYGPVVSRIYPGPHGKIKADQLSVQQL